MKQCYAIFICLLMLAGVACKKSKPANIDHQLYYTETQCSSNPWNKATLVAESDTKQIKNWLYQKGIPPLQITFSTNKDAVLCYACSCPTGRLIWVLFDPADIEKAKALGFRQR